MLAIEHHARNYYFLLLDRVDPPVFLYLPPTLVKVDVVPFLLRTTLAVDVLHIVFLVAITALLKMVGLEGFEPSAYLTCRIYSPVPIRRLSSNPINWYSWRDSNPQHLEPKSSVSASWTTGAWWIPEESNPDLSLFRRARTPATPEIHINLVEKTGNAPAQPGLQDQVLSL